MWIASPNIDSNRVLGMVTIMDASTKGLAERDLLLAGKYGMIWEYDDHGKYYILICSPKIANRYLSLTGDEKMKKGEEIGLICNEEEAKEWIKRLKVPNSRSGQLKCVGKIHG